MLKGSDEGVSQRARPGAHHMHGDLEHHRWRLAIARFLERHLAG
jgi:hypothetical protein